MNLFHYLDSRADRKDARRFFLAERGLDARSILLRIDPRFLVAMLIIALFAWAFAREGDKDTRNLMVGALIAAFAGAWGYYLGSSNTSARANDRADKALDLSKETLRQLPAPPAPDLNIAPGERVVVEGDART